MSLSIGEDRRLRALQPPETTENDQHRPHWLIRAVTLTSAGTALLGMGLIAAAFALEEWRTALAGSTLLIISALAGTVLAMNWLMADRQEFYRRGHLDGWHLGWRGLPPGSGDPLQRKAG